MKNIRVLPQAKVEKLIMNAYYLYRNLFLTDKMFMEIVNNIMEDDINLTEHFKTKYEKDELLKVKKNKGGLK